MLHLKCKIAGKVCLDPYVVWPAPSGLTQRCGNPWPGPALLSASFVYDSQSTKTHATLAKGELVV